MYIQYPECRAESSICKDTALSTRISVVLKANVSDISEFEGKIFKTKTGEISIHATDSLLLS